MKPLRKANQLGQFLACFTKAAQPDYKGTMMGGRSVVFEAKHSDKPRIEMNRVTDEQMAALDKHQQLGAICFVLVSIALEKFYVVPWEVWRRMPQLIGKKSMNENDLLPYIIPDVMHFLPLDKLKAEEKAATVENSSKSSETTRKDWPPYLDLPKR